MKPPLVFIHGWAQSPKAWSGQLAWFAARGRDATAPPLPGHGGAPDAPAAEWPRRLMGALPDAPCILVGWSLGGLLALRLALDAPARVKGLALVGATPCFRSREDWPHGVDEAGFRAFAEAAASGAPRQLQRFFLLMLHGDALSRAEVAAIARQAVDKRRPPSPRGLAAGLEILEAWDLRQEVAAIAAPALVMHGRCDAVTPPGAGRWLAARLPAGQWREMEGGHAPHLARPREFNETLEAWCERIT